MNSCIKLLLAVISLVAVIEVTNAARAIEIVEASPDDPNKCFRKRDNLTLTIGEEIKRPDCSQERCEKQGEDLVIIIESCGTVAVLEPCEKVEDKTKPYPDCCPTGKCPPGEAER